MRYPEAAWERAMTVQEVTLKAISGEVHWYRVADPRLVAAEGVRCNVAILCGR
jgi:hypothetical protein